MATFKRLNEKRVRHSKYAFNLSIYYNNNNVYYPLTCQKLCYKILININNTENKKISFIHWGNKKN